MADTKRSSVAQGIAARLASLPPEKRALLARRARPSGPLVRDLIGVGLARLGITHLYTLCGTPIHETVRACARNGIRIVGARHQTAGGQMAAAHNYLAGRMVAALAVSAGPAVTNAATSILVARDNCWPLIVIGGRRPMRPAGIGWFQEFDAVPVMQPITKWAATLDSAPRVFEFLARAYRIAVSGRPGPVYLDVPGDVMNEAAPDPEWPTDTADPVPAAEPVPEAVRRAAELLVSARRPLLIIGKGARWSQAFVRLTTLVDEFRVPFVTSPMGRGLVPDHHPLCLNPIASRAQSEADVVLVVGARLDYVFRFGGELARDAHIIQIDIEPAELNRNRTAEVAIEGDAATCVEAILAAARGRLGVTARDHDEVWHAKMAALADAARSESRLVELTDARPMTPHRMLREVRDAAPDDALFIVEGNVTMMSAEESLPANAPLTRMTAGHNGCMGIGLPFAIAAKLERPDRPVIVVCGDFSFGLAAMELDTAMRLRLPIVVLVANNSGATGHLKEFPEYADPVTTFVPDTRYDRIAEAFGALGECIEDPAELGPALRRALVADRPVCLNVAVEPLAPLPSR